MTDTSNPPRPPADDNPYVPPRVIGRTGPRSGY